MSMLPNGIVSLDTSDREQVRAAAALHEQLLADSPVPLLGRLFMERFYYSTLVKDGLIQCDLYRQDGRYVAFSVYTRYPGSFISQGIRRHFVYLCLLFTAALIAKPSRIKTILGMRGQNSKRLPESAIGKAGEYLSLGVLEEFQQIKHPETKVRISNMLFERAIEYFKANDYEEILLAFKVSNRRSMLFWLSYGAVLKERRYVSDESCLMTLRLDRK
jgi:hypothetical protein